MKKILFSLLLVALCCLKANAVPVWPHPVKMTQPDGSIITLQGHGDEFCNYITTTDGYTIVLGEDKYYHYAALDGGKLVSTSMRASDPEGRSASETAFLTNVQKYLAPDENPNLHPLASLASEARSVNGTENPYDVPLLSNRSMMDLSKFKGLVILVNFNDKTFRYGDDWMKSHVDDMMNVENWTSYDEDGETQHCTGSVHDYFKDNSYGMFAPNFDVVGPVTIDISCTYPQGSSNTYNLNMAAIDAVDDQVDFSQYDANGDGIVDMFYVIYAGYAASYSGNSSDYLWPHAYNMTYINKIRRDGVILGRYACSCEIAGLESVESETKIEGIGTICHEFSHVLGFMDHYDTSKQGHENPENWDVMANGNYNGTYSRTPAGYNAYERYTAGFLTPTILTAENHGEVLSIPSLESEATAYRIDTPKKKEFFLFENRQKDKWDSGLPGHGMLIWRVDSTSSTQWTNNKVNATNHLYFKLIRASGYSSSGSTSLADAFPGSKNVTRITNTTTPANLLSYNSYKSPVVIKNIKENDEIITCTIEDANYVKPLPEGTVFYESFDDCCGTGGNDGVFNTKMSPSTIVTDNDGWTYKTGKGCDQCAMFGSNSVTRESAITPEITLGLDTDYTLTFRAAPYNTDGTSLQVSIYNGDGTLTNDSIQGEQEEKSSIVLTMRKGQWTDYSLTLKGSFIQQIKFYGNTSNSKRFLLDEIVVKEKVEAVKGDVNGDGIVDIADVNAILTIMFSESGYSAETDANSDGVVDIADVNAVLTIIFQN